MYGKIYIAYQLYYQIFDLVSNKMGNENSIEFVELYEGGWGKFHNKTMGCDFYVNSDTKESSYTRPSGLKPLKRGAAKQEVSGLSAFPEDFNEHNTLNTTLAKAKPDIDNFRKEIVDALRSTTSTEIWCYPPIPQEGRRMVIHEFLKRFPRGKVYKVIQGDRDTYIQLTLETPIHCYNDRFLFQTE